MRLIVKGKEPKEWNDYRRTPGAEYEARKCLREALYKEQGGICAYCMRRLDNELNESITTNRIEHIKCREKHEDLKLVYTNMVMCCNGLIERNKVSHSICDRKKENNNIQISPLDPRFIASLSYNPTKGLICSTEVEWQKEMDNILNLNDEYLALNRIAAKKAINQLLGPKQWKVSQIRKKIEEYENRNPDGLYKPFCGMIAWYLKKKLKEAGFK